MTHLEAIRDQFARLVEAPEDRIDMVEAALLIARTMFPGLASSHYTTLLDQWADRAQLGLGPSPSVGDILRNLNRVLFDEEGLQGNQHNYYDLENSFINRVMDRKLGIPITLSLIYSEVGLRAGFPVYCIALSGHFIAGLFHAFGTLYVDPFNRGGVLSERECREMVAARFGREVAVDSSWQTPAGKKVILKRMLRNLKAIYRHSGQDLRAFEMIQWILTVDPDAPGELKERGLLYEAMGNFAFAARDLERYMELDPASQEMDTISRKISLLKRSGHWLH